MSKAAARTRWSAALLWVLATWTTAMGLLLAALVVHAAFGPGRLQDVVFAAVYLGSFVGLHMAVALAPRRPRRPARGLRALRRGQLTGRCSCRVRGATSARPWAASYAVLLAHPQPAAELAR
jgi:hypothetical protein